MKQIEPSADLVSELLTLVQAMSEDIERLSIEVAELQQQRGDKVFTGSGWIIGNGFDTGENFTVTFDNNSGMFEIGLD